MTDLNLHKLHPVDSERLSDAKASLVTTTRKLGKIPVIVDTSGYMSKHSHGTHKKIGVCLHETVSSDITGLRDINSIAEYLARKDYGILGVIDMEGYIAWAYGMRHAIFYHAASNGGNVNSNFMGIELISNVMQRSPSNAVRRKIWVARQKQLRTVAQVIAFLSRLERFPLQISDGRRPGVTTHWEVTNTFHVAGGHQDCWPIKFGGYFPRGDILTMSKAYAKLGY